MRRKVPALSVGRGTMLRRLPQLLCFALAARPARPHLLVSSLIYEGQAWADDAVANLLAFTLPSTHVVVHLSASSKTKLTKWAGREGRLHLNPRREATCSHCGMVARQHSANVRHAADIELGFAHVVYLSSECRLFQGGGTLEHVVRTHGFSRVSAVGWAQHAFKSGWGKGVLEPGDLLNDAAAPEDAKNKTRAEYLKTHKMGFTQHEGEYFPRGAALDLAAWVLDPARLGDSAKAARWKVQSHKGVAVEELLAPTWVLNRAKALGYDGKKAGHVACHHPVPRGVGLDRLVVHLRLGRDARRCPAATAIKGTFGKNRAVSNTRFLTCLAAADAALGKNWTTEQDQGNVLRCLAKEPRTLKAARIRSQNPRHAAREAAPCGLFPEYLNQKGGRPIVEGMTNLDLAVRTARWLLRDAKEKEASPLKEMLLAGDVSFLPGGETPKPSPPAKPGPPTKPSPPETKEATIQRLAARVAELEKRLGEGKR